MWHSTGGANLVQVIAPRSASPSSNSADFHVGVLRLPSAGDGSTSTTPEDWYFSGVYVESGSLTTSVSGPGGASGGGGGGSSSSSSVTTTATKTSTSASSSSTSASSTSSAPTTTTTGSVSQKYGQCGGMHPPVLCD